MLHHRSRSAATHGVLVRGLGSGKSVAQRSLREGIHIPHGGCCWDRLGSDDSSTTLVSVLRGGDKVEMGIIRC